jgi:K+-sensing histidine kinase KdpD
MREEGKEETKQRKRRQKKKQVSFIVFLKSNLATIELWSRIRKQAKERRQEIRSSMILLEQSFNFLKKVKILKKKLNNHKSVFSIFRILIHVIFILHFLDESVY